MIDDIDKIAHETAHSRFETLDAVENLVEQELARRVDGGFSLEPDGSRLLSVDWEETLARVRIQLDHVEMEIERLMLLIPTLVLHAYRSRGGRPNLNRQGFYVGLRDG